jgi:hypothetical protein
MVMSVSFLEVPLLSKTATFGDAIKRMRAGNVSVGVIEVGEQYHLIDFATIVRVGRHRRAERMVPLVESSLLPNVAEDAVEEWFSEPSIFTSVPPVPTMRSYAFLNVTGPLARIAILDKSFSGAAAAPLMYECSVDPIDHGPYFPGEVGNPPKCPSKEHRPPPPDAVPIA